MEKYDGEFREKFQELERRHSQTTEEFRLFKEKVDESLSTSTFFSFLLIIVSTVLAIVCFAK